MIRRPPRSTLSSSSAASDVYKRQRHGRTHNDHPRRLKSPNHSKFTILDPFYPRPFAFLFGLPAVPYRRGGTQCPKTDFSLKTFAKSLKQGTLGISRDHNSDIAGSAQNPINISPTMHPLNPFQSFVLHGTVDFLCLARSFLWYVTSHSSSANPNMFNFILSHRTRFIFPLV